MNGKGKIKVIKKGEIKIIETPQTIQKNTESDDLSEMNLTVSGWINEFQKRRLEETRLAFEQLYSN
jgi:hypothetical protein